MKAAMCDAIGNASPIGVYPKFAIDRRNRWMLKRSDVVVVFVNKNYGGAAKFEAIAKRQGKTVINLAKS